MSNEFVRIPPGHKVVVIHPSPQPQMGVTESKLVVLDFGVSGDWRTMLAKVETGLLGGAFPTTITILQMAMIDSLVTAGELSAFVAEWQSAKQQGWNAVWVLPNKASEWAVVVDLLKNAGFRVHGSAEDGACFVEVHKPDGTITVLDGRRAAVASSNTSTDQIYCNPYGSTPGCSRRRWSRRL